MTKKHFERAARIIKFITPTFENRMLLAKAFADYFTEENPRFDRERFMAACGLEPDKKSTVQ
jgi:hypothetical protein